MGPFDSESLLDKLRRLGENESSDNAMEPRMTNEQKLRLALQQASDALSRSLPYVLMNGISSDYAEIVQAQINAIAALTIPADDSAYVGKKLIGWRTDNFLWETSDIEQARNWEPNVGVLPIFNGDLNTKLPYVTVDL